MENKENYNDLLTNIGYKVNDIEWSKVQTWIGDNRRSDFEFYRNITEANQLNEKLKSFNSLGEKLGSPTDVFLSFLEYLSIEVNDKNTTKGNETYFDRMSEFIPPHDTIIPYPNWEEINQTENKMATDNNNANGDLQNQITLLTKFLSQLDEIKSKLNDSMGYYINTLKALESAKLDSEFLNLIKDDAREMQKKHIQPMVKEIDNEDKPRVQEIIKNLKKALALTQAAKKTN